MEVTDGVERRRGRRETDLAMLAHLAEILTEDPEAVFDHSMMVIERMEPVTWAWRLPSGKCFGNHEIVNFDRIPNDQSFWAPTSKVDWIDCNECMIFVRRWDDGETFLFGRPAEVTGAERWELYLVGILACQLRNARKTSEIMNTRDFAFYGNAETETLAHLDNALERTAGLELSLSVAYFTINGVSSINEREGLAAGDRVFNLFGELIRSLRTELVWYGRAGTVGMLVILPAQSRQETEAWIEESIPQMEKTLGEETGSNQIRITGVVATSPTDGKTAAELAETVGIFTKDNI